jgi:hypothetical protein
MFSDFIQIPFSDENNIVYVVGIIYYKSKFIPFYVGQSSRNIGRFGDYISAKYTAPTDFKVGEAIKYFKSKKYEVFIKYKELKNSKEEEKKLIENVREELQKYNKNNIKLLNDINGYNYQTSNEEQERKKIEDYVDGFLDGLHDYFNSSC